MPLVAGKSRAARALIIGFAVTIATLAVSMAPADAGPMFCQQLQADFASASRSAGGGGDASQIRREYAQVQAQARRLGCQRFLFFGPRPSSQCPAVNARLNRLQRDLNRSGGGGFGFGFGRNQAVRQRDYLRQALIENGCEIPSLGWGWGGSGYRTLCVRTCDGYYFPISFSTSRQRFKTDEVVCKAMYGGSTAELFVHSNNTPPEQAVSLTGKPLVAEPYAFQFRRRFDATCQGELHAGIAKLGSIFVTRLDLVDAKQNAAPRPKLAVPVPVARIAPSEDPETLANIAGDFRIEPAVPPEKVAPAAVADASAHIRLLGSDYYYVEPVKIEALGKKPAKPPGLNFIGSAHADERPVEADPPAQTIE